MWHLGAPTSGSTALLQPHRLVSPFLSPPDPIDLPWAQSGSPLPSSLLWVTQAKFSVTQNRNLTFLPYLLAPQQFDPELGAGKGGCRGMGGRNNCPGSQGESRRSQEDTDVCVLARTLRGTLHGFRGPTGPLEYLFTPLSAENLRTSPGRPTWIQDSACDSGAGESLCRRLLRSARPGAPGPPAFGHRKAGLREGGWGQGQRRGEGGVKEGGGAEELQASGYQERGGARSW